LIAHFQLAAICPLYFGRQQLVPERCAADHIVNVDVAGPNSVTRWNSRTRPLDSIRGGGKVHFSDNVEIRHAVIVAMPLLHCLLFAPSGKSRRRLGQCSGMTLTGSLKCHMRRVVMRKPNSMTPLIVGFG
jgi:hypothetical protein